MEPEGEAIAPPPCSYATKAGPCKAMGPSFNPSSQTGYTWADMGQLFHPIRMCTSKHNSIISVSISHLLV